MLEEVTLGGEGVQRVQVLALPPRLRIVLKYTTVLPPRFRELYRTAISPMLRDSDDAYK